MAGARINERLGCASPFKHPPQTKQRNKKRNAKRNGRLPLNRLVVASILRAAGYEFIAFLYAVDIRLVCDTALFRRILVKLTENSIRNIMTAIENGGTSNTAMKRLRELKGKNAELEKQMRIEQSHSAFKLYRKEIADFYKFALEQSRKC